MNVEALVPTAVLALLFGLAWIRTRGRRSIVLDPVTVLLTSWLLVVVVSLVPGVMLPELTSFVPSVGIMAALATAVGIFVATQVPIRNRPETVLCVDVPKLERFHLALVGLLGLFVLVEVTRTWPIVRGLGGVGAMWSSTGSQFRSYQRLARLNELASGGSLLLSAIGYITFGGMAALVTGGVLWRLGRRMLALLPLIVLVVYTSFTLERTTFVAAVLTVSFASVGARAMGVENERLYGRVASAFATRAILLTVLCAALLVPLTVRNRGSANSVGLVSLVQYGVSGVAGLNLRSASLGGWEVPVDSFSGMTGDVPGYGAYTFYALFDILRRFGFDVPVAPLSSDYRSVSILGLPFNTNVATLVSDFYFDLGWLGVIMGFAALGFVAWFARRMLGAGSSAWVGVYAITMAAIAWSFFGNAILTELRFAVVLVFAGIALTSVCGRSRQVCGVAIQ